jgi:hypothetical protein
MAFTLIQAGSTLKFLGDDGTVGANLVIPSGINLSTTKPARFLNIDGYTILVNTPDQPLLIDSQGTVRLLVPRPPRLAPVIAGVGSGGLTGTYTGVRYTFIVEDINGNLISESDYSPASGSATLTNQLLQASGLDISSDTITGRRLYRPTSNGSVLFQWVDLDGNVLTSIQDDLPDAALSEVASPILGNPPYLTLIGAFRGRIFGVAGDDIDNLRYTEAGIRYSWPADNIIPVQDVGSDNIGITAIIGRRDALGVGRLNQISQITGTGAEDGTGNIDFDNVILSRELGVLSQESVAVYRDTAYFLWYDGVYQWDSSGFKNISDEGGVSSWFNTNNYFNRSRFPFAFAGFDPIRTKYRLCLASAGSDVEDTWVEFDIEDRTWWGPHNTTAFSPASMVFVTLPDNSVELGFGSRQGDVNTEQETRTDGMDQPIAFDVVGKRHDNGTPDDDKYFGQLSMYGKVQPAGTLTITSKAGELEATTPLVQQYDMTKNRQRLGRLGVGKHVELEFENDVVGQDVNLYGYVIDPVHVLGRR